MAIQISMEKAVEEVRRKLWRGQDPLSEIPRALEIDAQGWGSTHHPYLTEFLSQLRPRVVVEVGVWKGGSTIFIAERLRELGLDAVVIAVDTWLGIWQHWARDEWLQELQLRQGYPSLYYKFAANIVAKGLQDYVVPLPLDSVNARQLVSYRDIVVDMIHIDAGHDYDSVTSDLAQWWQALRRGGLYIGDDYGAWPEVKRATDDFLLRNAHQQFQVNGNKCMAVKI